MCGPHFCSMRITKGVRNFATERGLETTEAIEKGMAEKAKEFSDKGGKIYS